MKKSRFTEEQIVFTLRQAVSCSIHLDARNFLLSSLLGTKSQPRAETSVKAGDD